MQRLGVVIPTLNESKKIQRLIPKLQKKYKNCLIFVIDDCSKDGTAEIAKELGAIVPFHSKKKGYGKSLVEGLNLAWFTHNCDYVLEMDADHPIDQIDKFIKAKKTRRFVVVGREKDNLARAVTRFLVRGFLRLKDVRHPTCGFVLWSKKVLENIPWKHVRSRWDAIHVELLFWAWRMGADIREVEFSGHVGERRYGFRRILSWLISYSRLLRLKYFWRWREFG